MKHRLFAALIGLASIPLLVSTCLALNGGTRTGMPFIKNAGQAPNHVKYYVSTPKASVFVDTNDRINYAFTHEQTKSSVVIRELMVNGSPLLTEKNQQTTRINHMIGNDQGKWQTDIPNFSELSFGEVWQGIDVKLITRPGNVEKIFTLKPQANVSEIELSFEGVLKLNTDADGQLEILTALGTVAFSKPVAWQEIDHQRVPVEVSYQVDGNHYGFSLGTYNHAEKLIIDPLLASTYMGGGLDEVMAGVHVNSNNEIIIAGATASTDFPSTVGVFNDTHAGGYDFIVMKLNADMSQLLAATFFGGSSYDAGTVAAFDSNDNIYIAGESRSADFPFPPSPYVPYQQTEDANGSIFVVGLSADLTEIIGATHIGGDVVDLVRAIEIAPNGNIYLTGFTNSNNYPYTSGALETTGKGIVLSVFNPDLSELLYSTKLGGGSGYAIDIDVDGSVFIAGGKAGPQTYSTTSGVYSEAPINSLGEQIYLAHLSADLSTLIEATFIHFGIPNHIKVSSDDQLLISANTTNGVFPVAMTAFDDSQLVGGSTTLFTIDKTMTDIASSTFIDLGFDQLLLEDDGNILVFGASTTQDFPGGNSPSDTLNSGFHGGQADFVIARMNAGLSQVSHSSYIGGSAYEHSAKGLIKDDSGNVIVAGMTTSNDIFLTENAYDKTNAGNGDFIILKAASDLNFGPFIDDIYCDSFESPSRNGVCP